MFARILTSALFAGAAAGLSAGLLQLVFVQPVLLQSELYESGRLVHFGAEAAAAMPDPGAFQPLRDGLSVIFTMLIYTGYALLLVAAMALAERRGVRVDARTGIVWGIAGFAAFQLAPAFSLAPEVPGVAAADVAARQAWWSVTVATAAAAGWLIAFARGWVAWGAAAALLLAPHLFGAPMPERFSGPVPPELAALFAARALGVGAVAWLLLGCLAGHFWRSEGEQAGSTRAA